MSKSPKISIGYYEELKRQVENISASKIINQALDVLILYKIQLFLLKLLELKKY